MNRAKLSILNSSLSVLVLIITNIVAFVYRTALVKVMGVEYVGITGLCANLLGVFCLADLGVSWAISFYLYKPINEKNYEQIASIINMLRKFYRYIGVFIIVVGLLCLPFLELLIKSDHPIENLTIIYLMFLTNTVMSYLFFSYYEILINADRKNYKLFKARALVPIICTLLQLCAIVLFRNFLLAVFFLSLSTLTQNIWIRHIARKEYPYLNDYCQLDVEVGLKNQIYAYIRATMLYKVSLTVMQSSTSLIISSFIGITILGIYSNFMLIVDTIRGLMLNTIHPMTAIIGEINAGETIAYKQEIFNRLNFLMYWICIFCSTCLVVLLKPFVILWLGCEYSLPMSTIILIVSYFYFEFLTAFSTKFRDACGLNNFGKYRPLVTAVVNIVLSLLLVGKWGINGILFAMVFSRVATITWFEPWIVYRHVFKQPIWAYYRECTMVTLLAVISAVITHYIFTIIWTGTWETFIFGCGICVIVPNIMLFISTYRSDNFNYYYSLLVHKIKN